jgi:hypothetical protein
MSVGWDRAARVWLTRFSAADLYITETPPGGPPLESTGLTPPRGKVRTSGAAGQARRIGGVAVARGARSSGIVASGRPGERAVLQ